MTNSVAVPVIEYRVWTKCGRMFVWAATDSQDLLDSVVRAGYSINVAMPELSFQEQVLELDEFDQLEHNDALQEAIAS